MSICATRFRSYRGEKLRAWLLAVGVAPPRLLPAQPAGGGSEVRTQANIDTLPMIVDDWRPGKQTLRAGDQQLVNA